MKCLARTSRSPRRRKKGDLQEDQPVMLCEFVFMFVELMFKRVILFNLGILHTAMLVAAQVKV